MYGTSLEDFSYEGVPVMLLEINWHVQVVFFWHQTLLQCFDPHFHLSYTGMLVSVCWKNISLFRIIYCWSTVCYTPMVHLHHVKLNQEWKMMYVWQLCHLSQMLLSPTTAIHRSLMYFSSDLRESWSKFVLKTSSNFPQQAKYLCVE